MTNPRYFLAKYIPDLARIEPRNVGVILWSPHGTVARFAAEKAGRPGEVDGRSTAQFGIVSTDSYRQWIEFWRCELDKTSISPIPCGPPASKDCPQFLDALASFNRGNFVLAEGGFLLEAISPGQMNDALNDLYQRLVEPTSADEARDHDLNELCDRLLAKTRIDHDPYFKKRYEIPCQVGRGVEERFEFSYAYGNGAPKRLYQKVPLSQRTNRSSLRRIIDSTAWMFEKVVQNQIVAEDQVVSIVYLPSHIAKEHDIARGVSVLQSKSRILNIGDEDQATEEFRRLPAEFAISH